MLTKWYYSYLKIVGRIFFREVLLKCSIRGKKVIISNFDEDEFESLSNVLERFKLSLRKCPNYNMSFMK